MNSASPASEEPTAPEVRWSPELKTGPWPTSHVQGIAVDPDKGFHNSITLDLIVEESGNRLQRTSVRGTVTESRLMVARINEFDRLYFEPSGPMLFCIYDDRPGVIATVSRRLADLGINIEDMRNPHDPKTNRSLLIFKLNRPVEDSVVSAIGAEISAISAISVSLE